MWRETDPHLTRLQKLTHGKARLTTDLFSDDLLQREPHFVDYALQDAVLLPAVDYFGTVPYLARLALAVSVHMPELRAPNHHQRFHIDNDDFFQFKMFVNVTDVEFEDGPLTFLPADVSARVLANLRREGQRPGQYGTFSDADVFRHCDPSEQIQMLGPAGTTLFVDLSRCLHFGSRVQAGRERLMLCAWYLRYHRLHENPSSQLDASRDGLDPLRKLALASPQPRPHGFFCPDPVVAAETLAAVNGTLRSK